MRKVLITGGTRGIGRALVETFLQNGDEVAFIYRDSSDKAAELSRAGAVAFCCDLAKPEQVEKTCIEVLTLFGSPDVFISNAGVSSFSLFTEFTNEEWARVRSVNLDAPVLITRAMLPGMIAKKYGRIVYISSMWGQVGASCEVAYSAAKAALLGLTKALAKEVGPSGITVNCVCPGVIDTDMNAHLDAQTLRELQDETPLQRLGTPEETAKLCAYLCSDDASFITGQVVGINGGFVVT